MSIWNSIWTCPGWIFCTRKPHPFGDECHTALCELSGILLVVELVEDKEYPCHAGPLEFEDLGGKTVRFLFHMMERYFSAGRYVILDCGFCVLKGLIQLSKNGVFSCAVINKRRYWTSMVPGKYMEDHFGGGEGGGDRFHTRKSG